MRRELLGFGLANDGQLAIQPQTEEGCVRIPEHIIGVPQGANGASIAQIACGERHTLILAEDGKIWWVYNYKMLYSKALLRSVGHNECGQIGRGRIGSGSFTIYPIEFTLGSKIIQIACGKEHSVCVAEDGRAFAWGNNSSGQLGIIDNGIVERPKRVEVGASVCQVACGPDHTIFLCQNGSVYVCGLTYDGAMIHRPRQVLELIGVPIIRVAAGGRHWVAVSSSGSVFTWGQNDSGQLGTGDLNRHGSPVLLDNVSRMGVVDVSCGDAHTVLLTKSGQIFTFGSNTFGQLGSGRRGTPFQTMPSAVDDLMGTQVTRIAAGRCHTVAVVKGRVYTFGLNSYGQLGNGSSQKQLVPKPLENCDQVASIFSGWDHTFIVRVGGPIEAAPGPSAIFRYPLFLNKKVIADYLIKREKLDLIGDLEIVFTSLSLINGSFLHEGEQRYKLSENNHGVNLDDVMEAFDALGLSSDSKQYSDLIIESCGESLFGRNFQPKNFLSDECLRAFLILPWVQAFLKVPDNGLVTKLHIPFCNAYRSLQAKQQIRLETWWKIAPVRHFNRIVSGLVAGIGKLVEKSANVNGCTTILYVLAKLNTINNGMNKIPLENFYVNNLAEKVDLKMDYYRWVVSKQQGQNNEVFWSNFPFIMNGPAKGDLLHVDAALQQQAMVNNSVINIFGQPYMSQNPMFHFKVRRNHIVEDTVTMLPQVSRETLHKPLRVEFVGEEGEDGGGIRKEYFMLLFQQILQPEYGMFVEDHDSHLVWFSGNESEPHGFQMVGILCALAVYNNVLVAFPFPLALYKLLLNKKVVLEDFCELYPVEGKGLQALLDYEEDDFEHVFGLDFTITHMVYGHPTEIELKEGGKETPVTQKNKQEYIELYVKSKLEGGVNGEIGKQFNYFKEGFTQVMNSRLINLFQPRELMELVVGSENYDWNEFKKMLCTSCATRRQQKREKLQSSTASSRASSEETNMKKRVNIIISDSAEKTARGVGSCEADLFETSMENFHTEITQASDSTVSSRTRTNTTDTHLMPTNNVEVVQYEGVFHAKHPSIIAFWAAFDELSLEERKKFLQFLSGSTRLPVQGMKAVKVKIQPCAEESLPVAHTCANTLDLPKITNSREMLRRLRISLEHTSGFTLV